MVGPTPVWRGDDRSRNFNSKVPQYQPGCHFLSDRGKMKGNEGDTGNWGWGTSTTTLDGFTNLVILDNLS